MKLSHQKLKLLHLLKILEEKTDEEHTLTIPQMIEELGRLGISAERKSIYDDLDHLELFGVDLCHSKSKTHDYFIGCRDFELAELKLLVDSVQSSKFITHKKSMELISKIAKLTSKNNAKKLQRQVFITNRVKTLNEKIYYNVDKIHEAIAANKQIQFLYYEWDLNKKKKYRKNGEHYVECPLALTWDDENYYLITYHEDHEYYKHYRVDKMDQIEIIEDNRTHCPKEFDLAKYSKSVFSMFSGEEAEVSIQFHNELVGVVIDRFGMDVPIIKCDEEHFIATVNVAVSPHFLSWLISFGDKAKILSPESVKDETYELLRKTIQIYE